MKLASTHIHNVVKNWHVMAETPAGRELANKIALGQLHDPVESPRRIDEPGRETKAVSFPEFKGNSRDEQERSEAKPEQRPRGRTWER